MLRPPANPTYQSKAEELIEALRRRKDDWHSEPGLQNIGPRTTDELLDIIRYEKSRAGQELCVVLLLFVLLPISAGIALYHHNPAPLVPLVCLCPLMIVKPNVRLRYAVYALSQTNDLRVLQTLILATRSSWGCHPQVIAAIERLLKQVTTEHAGLLNSDAQYRLRALALPTFDYYIPYNEPLALQTLHVLTAIGNRDTFVWIQQLTCQPALRNAHKRIVAVAQELLPLMETRLKLQEIPDTLLRAADTPTSQPETLLRPALVVTPEPTEQLLRASTGEEREA